MKNKFISFLFVTVLAVTMMGTTVFAEEHTHDMSEATCTEPSRCNVADCDYAEGEPLGHSWNEATCTAPKTCSRCSATEGEALGHALNEDGNCTQCDYRSENTSPAHEHVYDEYGECEICGDFDPEYVANHAPSGVNPMTVAGHTHTTHVFDQLVSVTYSADCTVNLGSGTYQCSVVENGTQCEEVETGRTVAPMPGHTPNAAGNACVYCPASIDTTCLHQNVYRNDFKGHHYPVCKICNLITGASANCSFTAYSSNSDGEHTIVCSVCGYGTLKEGHSFEYDYDDDHRHKVKCKKCGYTGKRDCDYKDGKCLYCGHRKDPECCYPVIPLTLEGRKANPLVSLPYLRAEGQALPANYVLMNIGGAYSDVAAVISSPVDTMNQIAAGSLMLTQLGYTKLTPSLTFNMYSFNTYAAPNAPQTITWTRTSLRPGDTAFVVYWDSVNRQTVVLPTVIDAFGNVAFAVPNMAGTTIMTLIQCS